MTIHLDHATVIKRDRLSDGTECFVAEDPALPGCVAYGKTAVEAAEQFEEVKQAYLRVADRKNIRS